MVWSCVCVWLEATETQQCPHCNGFEWKKTCLYFCIPYVFQYKDIDSKILRYPHLWATAHSLHALGARLCQRWSKKKKPVAIAAMICESEPKSDHQERFRTVQGQHRPMSSNVVQSPNIVQPCRASSPLSVPDGSTAACRITCNAPGQEAPMPPWWNPKATLALSQKPFRATS